MIRLLVSSIVLSTLLACQPTSQPIREAPTTTPTSAPVDPQVATVAPDLIEEQAAAPKEAPLRFVFPTPVPPPVSVWRPPLYDTPWALGPYDHFFFARPIAADEVNWPLADYRYGDFFPGTDIVHTGVDIDATRGTPVLASGEGKVVWAGYGLYRGVDDPDDPYGLAVAIKHNFGWNSRFLYTIYAHMDRIDVQVGQKVKTGDTLGIVGNTGNTTGPHLHFEVRIESNSFYVTRNPELWLAPPQGWGVLVGRMIQWDNTPIRKLEVQVRSKETGRVWLVRTYGPVSVNSDDYYRENLVLSDLPAGEYEVSFDYNDVNYRLETDIQPGAIRYFTFRQYRGFNLALPTDPELEEWYPAVDPQ